MATGISSDQASSVTCSEAHSVCRGGCSAPWAGAAEQSGNHVCQAVIIYEGITFFSELPVSNGLKTRELFLLENKVIFIASHLS